MNRPDNCAAFYSLPNRMHASDRNELKKSIVLQFASGRTDSLREMTGREYLTALRDIEKTASQNAG